MNLKKPLLINVPQIDQSSANTSSDLATIINTAESAAEVIRAKVDADAQRRQELVAGITDDAMRRSLTK